MDAEVILLNEIGLDPGIDHCSAIEMLGGISREGKRVLSFTSFCGGLPAPEDSDVPLRYKFSWRPLGVLTAALNDAKYLLNKRVCICCYSWSKRSLIGSAGGLCATTKAAGFLFPRLAHYKGFPA